MYALLLVSHSPPELPAITTGSPTFHFHARRNMLHFNYLYTRHHHLPPMSSVQAIERHSGRSCRFFQIFWYLLSEVHATVSLGTSQHILTRHTDRISPMDVLGAFVDKQASSVMIPFVFASFTSTQNKHSIKPQCSMPLTSGSGANFVFCC